MNDIKLEKIKAAGFPFYVDPEDQVISRQLKRNGAYSGTETGLILKILNPGDFVVNVGAHIGYFSVLMAKKLYPDGHVFSFEPDPKNFQILEKNVDLNKLDNVSLIRKAVMHKEGVYLLHRSKTNTGDHCVYPVNDRQALWIGGITLDKYFEHYSGQIDFIKIDTQGAEDLVIKGAMNLVEKNKKLKMIIEYYPYGLVKCGSDPVKFLVDLKRFGVHIYDIRRKMLEIDPKEMAGTYRPELRNFTNLYCVKGE
jgi:FkbM family methyltransferase